MFEDIDRMIHPELVIDREVYNLDAIKSRSGINFISDNSNISNRDEFRYGLPATFSVFKTIAMHGLHAKLGNFSHKPLCSYFSQIKYLIHFLYLNHL